MSKSNYPVTVLDHLGAIITDVTPSFDCLNFNEIFIDFNITNVSGTTPTIVMTIQQSTDNVNWVTLYAFASKNAIGHHVYYIPDGSIYGFARYVRGSYVIGGTTPVFTFTLNVVAKE